MNIENTAAGQLATLSINRYPGRGIIMGVDKEGKNLVQVYWIMGRSENSRNRVLKITPGVRGLLYTSAADPSKVKDPSLIIYNAMREVNDDEDGTRSYIVSNGDQTDTVNDRLSAGTMQHGLGVYVQDRVHEPDIPNYTSRITGLYRSYMEGHKLLELHIIRRSEFAKDDDLSDHTLFSYERDDVAIEAGFGRCITTYGQYEDGVSSLKPFHGDPLLVPLRDTPQDILRQYWNILNEENRISIAVKAVPLDGGPSSIEIINKYSEV